MDSIEDFDNFIKLKTTQPNFCIENGMTLEVIRLCSFEKWPPEAPLYPTTLAKSGFYYTGSADEVSCFSCKVKIGGWHAGDDPDKVHRSRQPNCGFVNCLEERNVPWTPQEDPEAMARLTSRNSAPHDNDMPDSHHINRPQLQENIGNGEENYLRFETQRLKTFENWPHAVYIKPENLAKAGFYFIGPPDRVRCHFCSGVLRNWERGDVPMTEHRTKFPSCPFLCGREVGNVPTETSSEDQIRTNGFLTTAKYPEMSTYEQRLATYQTSWPDETGQSPELLAEAGFFSLKTGDKVKCFECGGMLRNWERDDLPFTEHARWFPRCDFLLKKKGHSFVRNIQGSVPTPMMAEAAAAPERSSINNQGANSNMVFPSGVEYRVDPREVKARLDTSAVKTVLGLGFSKDTVKECIDRRLRTTGDDFPSAESLLDAIFNMEEELAILQTVKSDGPLELEDDKKSQNTDSNPLTDNSEKNETVRKGSTEDNVTNNDPLDILEEDPASLMKENMSLKEQRTCKVCMDDEVNVVFLPCGHLVCCSTCAPALNKCPVCRAVIRGTVKIYAT